eukprot:14629_1
MLMHSDHLFKEPNYLAAYPYKSTYLKSWHLRYQKRFRDFLNNTIVPFANKWNEQQCVPDNIYQKCYDAGFYSFGYTSKYGGQLFENNVGDIFSLMIKFHEISRIGSVGIQLAIWGTVDITAPMLIEFGSEYLKTKYLNPVLRAKKIICLAISEVSAGSDVSAIRTTATEDKNDVNYFRINGEKCFITNGNKANYYVTAVKYENKIMVLIIDKDFVCSSSNNGQIITNRMKTQGCWASDTAYVILKNVKVPKINVIGEKHMGFQIIMSNFNHERFAGCALMNGLSRLCFNESVKYAKDRKTFGKYLVDHQVIRDKLVEMIRNIESTHSMVEKIAYLLDYKNKNKITMIKNGNYRKFMKQLSSLTALGKIQASKSYEYCARESVQIFGGRGCVRDGRGAIVERLYREVRVLAIGGGSEEILTDFVARQAKL